MKSIFLLIFSSFVLITEASFGDDLKMMIQFIDVPDYIHKNLLEKGVSKNCSRDIYETADALNAVFMKGNSTDENMWAIQVMDSMPSMISGGIITGNLWQLGRYDECLDVTNPKDLFIGQHCVLNIEMDLIDQAMAGTVYEQYHPAFHYGVCIPSTCSIDDINLMANNYSETYLVTATEENCWTRDKTWKYNTGDRVVITVLGLLLAATILSTLYEGIQIFKKNDKLHPLYSSFSAIKNCRGLFSIRKGGIPCIDGMRVATIIWMVDNHVYLNYAYMPMVNSKENEENLDSESYVFIWNGVFATDTFLFITGLMAGIVFLRSYGTKKYYDIPVNMLHRMMRITPAFAVVIAISATVFRTLGRGPNWYQAYEYLESACQEKWWTSLLYVSNYVDPETMCIFPSWFLSVDMQLYWISPFILFPVVFWPKVGTFLLFMMTIGSSLLTFGLDQAQEMYMNIRKGGMPQWTDDYITTHTRATPWFAGVCLAVILSYQINKKMKVKLSKTAVILGWTISTICCLGGLLSSFRFLHDRPFTWTETAAYIAFTRLAWGIGIAWVIYACYNGYGGPANWILSLPLFQPLGKLSYSIFLIHNLVQKYRAGLLRNAYYYTELTQAYFFFGDYAISTACAFVLYIAVEAPFVNLDKVLFGNLKILPLPWPKSTKEENTDVHNQDKNGVINEVTANITIENEENTNTEKKIVLEMTENEQEGENDKGADKELKTAL